MGFDRKVKFCSHEPRVELLLKETSDLLGKSLLSHNVRNKFVGFVATRVI